MKQERHNIHDFHFHLVFVTKYRKPIFTTDTRRNELKQLLQRFAKANGSTIEEMEVMPDHVHMVLSFPPKYAPSSIVKSFKGAAAREWFKLHPEDKQKLYKGHLWSPSFFMRTIGVVSKDIVLEYVKNQLTKTPRSS